MSLIISGKRILYLDQFRFILPTVSSNLFSVRFQSKSSKDELREKLKEGPEFSDFLKFDSKEIKQKYTEKGIQLNRVKGERLRLPPWLKTNIPLGKLKKNIIL